MTTEIFVIDDQAPEDVAMLQALYSRSPAGVQSHLEKLKSAGSGKFMSQYYVGYGHASIGDCGSTTIFIEQVSMLVAKAIQDNALYSGQEASTRYLDFSKQDIIDPYSAPASTAIQEKWMVMYNRTIAQLKTALEIARPFDPNAYKSEIVWKNTLNARAFDIARAILPVGATTLLSWSTNLRQARDHLRKLKHHPIPEVRDVATQIFAGLKEKYANSFRGDELITWDTRDDYAAEFAGENHIATPTDLYARYNVTDIEKAALLRGDFIVRREAIDIDGLNRNEKGTLAKRPSGANLPWRLESYGRYNGLFLLDFGSYRDVQRHRNGVCQVPLVTADYGIDPWYMDQFKNLLQPSDFAQLQNDIAAQITAVKSLGSHGIDTSPELDQYLYPMGMRVLAHVGYSVPQMVYVGELRSGKTVHGSLRPVAQKMLRVLENDFPGMAIYGDFDTDDWSAKRGEQTIAEKVANG